MLYKRLLFGILGQFRKLVKSNHTNFLIHLVKKLTALKNAL